MPANSDKQSQNSREISILKALPTNLYDKVRSSRVLVVGAGGIGCELLKNLVLSGFRQIELVDLDTIDVSNLNRQFLFQKQHVKQPKALVAALSAERFNPGVTIIPHHANIKDKKFDLKWFKSFDLVMNALDNLDARRYVNKMCLDAKIPLIEPGTAGYIGQTTVISKGVTECYDCIPKETPKTYPVCTIRMTPSLPIHSIVWSKSYLFNQLFGEDEDSAIDMSKNDENATQVDELKKEAEILKKIRDSLDSPDFCKLVFEKVFTLDIERLNRLEDLWKDKTPPTPLDFDELQSKSEQFNSELEISDTSIPTLEESFILFAKSLEALALRLVNLKKVAPTSCLYFDKDDYDALKFVASASNIRSHIFGIENKSTFDIKAIAGNIIPAIATTNAIIAGVVVIQAFRLLQNQIEDCRTTFLVSGNNRPRLLCTEPLAKPNPECGTCSIDSLILPVEDLGSYTIKEFLKILVPKIIHIYKETILESEQEQDIDSLEEYLSITEGTRSLFDPDFLDNYENSFSSLNITYGSKLSIEFDFDQFKSLSFLIQPLEEGLSFPCLVANQTLATTRPSLQRPLSDDDSMSPKRQHVIAMEEDDDILIIN